VRLRQVQEEALQVRPAAATAQAGRPQATDADVRPADAHARAGAQAAGGGAATVLPQAPQDEVHAQEEAVPALVDDDTTRAAAGGNEKVPKKLN
jgi:hypothetical protein